MHHWHRQPVTPRFVAYGTVGANGHAVEAYNATLVIYCMHFTVYTLGLAILLTQAAINAFIRIYLGMENSLGATYTKQYPYRAY